jgi:hypothetical protein
MHKPMRVENRAQAQVNHGSNSPYVGRRTRRADSRHDDLTSLLYDRRVVRSTLLRCSQDLVGADDFRWLRELADTQDIQFTVVDDTTDQAERGLQS